MFEPGSWLWRKWYYGYHQQSRRHMHHYILMRSGLWNTPELRRELFEQCGCNALYNHSDVVAEFHTWLDSLKDESD